MNRWANQNTNTAMSYEIGVHRMCTAHHLEALADSNIFGDTSCLLEGVRPSTKLAKSIAAAINDPSHHNIRAAMQARMNKWGTVGMGDFVLMQRGAEFFHGRIDALFDQEQRSCCDGPMAIFHLAVVTADLPRSWKLKWSQELYVVDVCDFSCSLMWTGDEDIAALKPEFLLHRIE